MKQFYSGDLGNFEYDDTEFRLCDDYNKDLYLAYIGSETDGSKIKIPDGIIKCDYMFRDHVGLTSAPIIPEGVKSCKAMFEGCDALETMTVIPDSVENCEDMFRKCINLKRSESISKNAKNCNFMFDGCLNLKNAPIMPNKIEFCNGMFRNCICLQEAHPLPLSAKQYMKIFANTKFDGAEYKDLAPKKLSFYDRLRSIFSKSENENNNKLSDKDICD